MGVFCNCDNKLQEQFTQLQRQASEEINKNLSESLNKLYEEYSKSVMIYNSTHALINTARDKLLKDIRAEAEFLMNAFHARNNCIHRNNYNTGDNQK